MFDNYVIMESEYLNLNFIKVRCGFIFPKAFANIFKGQFRIHENGWIVLKGHDQKELHNLKLTK